MGKQTISRKRSIFPSKGNLEKRGNYCSDFNSGSEVRDYFRACPGDPSGLDGDDDGVPYESLCR